jgi:ABC-type transport system involved in multi-copper enzyme maturation permease subunit
MKTIIRREFLDHVQSLQFIVLFALSVVLFAASGFVYVRAQAEREVYYRTQMTRAEQHPSTMGARLVRRPNPLGFMAAGGDQDRPSGYDLQGGELTPIPVNPRTFKLPAIPALDWSFLIRVLFSLYVVLLGYDAVSGEKERGTLRLILANPLGRVKLLVGKYCSIMAAASVPFAAGVLVSLIIIGAFLPGGMAAADLGRVLFVFFLVLAYFSLFAFLSLLFSSLISRSSLVLLALLAVWVCFAVVIPSSSIVLAEKLSAAPSETQSARMFEPMVQKEVWAKIGGVQERVNRGEFRTEDEIHRETDRIFEEGQVKVTEFYANYARAENERGRKAKAMSRISPAALFQYAAEDIAGTGDTGEENFLSQCREHSRAVDGFILRKLGKVVRVSRWSFSTNMEFQGKPIVVRSPQPLNYEGDMSDYPKFEERRPGFGQALRSAFGDLAGLLVWNILLAGLAFSAFLRTDVR